MSGPGARWALTARETEIVTQYLAGDQAVERHVTLRTACVRELVPALADVAVRGAERIGPALATFDHARMRDAAIAVAIRRRLADADADHVLAERILAALVHRSDSALRRSLMSVSVRLPPDAVAVLDAESRRAAGGSLDGSGWIGCLTEDVRSAIVEALLVDWTAARALAGRPL